MQLSDDDRVLLEVIEEAIEVNDAYREHLQDNEEDLELYLIRIDEAVEKDETLKRIYKRLKGGET